MLPTGLRVVEQWDPVPPGGSQREDEKEMKKLTGVQGVGLGDCRGDTYCAFHCNMSGARFARGCANLTETLSSDTGERRFEPKV